jgi:fructokinase
MLLGAVEIGGTKVRCAIGTGPENRVAECTVPTGSPDETLSAVIAFFAAQPSTAAIGVGCFGPVDLRPASPTWGHIRTTPKSGWSNTSVAPRIAQQLGVPVAFDTDVGAALRGECRWGALQGVHAAVYLTVGTGIGGAAVVAGQPVVGAAHPEMGHVPVSTEPDDPLARGICPFHGDCLEGRAAGPALTARWGVQGEDLPDDHPAWDLEARYLALGIRSVGAVLAPDRVVVGGGLGLRPGLLALVRRHLERGLGGYGGLPYASTWVVPAGLGADAGLLGGFALAATLSRPAAPPRP